MFRASGTWSYTVRLARTELIIKGAVEERAFSSSAQLTNPSTVRDELSLL
jgi:hypothetical protein